MVFIKNLKFLQILNLSVLKLLHTYSLFLKLYLKNIKKNI